MFAGFFRFDRYLTPSLVQIFYMLQLVLIVLFALSGLFSALGVMAYSIFGGLIAVIGVLVGAAVALVAARIVTEIIMVLFQNNEHLAVIRARAEGR